MAAAATATNTGNSPSSTVGAMLPSTPNTKKQLFNGPCYLKMLVSNLVAGSIIGKNGTVISRIESNTETSMKLSPTNHFFPGTNDRIVVISGEQEAVQEAMSIVIDKIGEVTSAQYGGLDSSSNVVASEPRSARGELTVKFAIPKSSVSGIIGKAGQQIKQLQEDSKAKIQISNRESGLNERVVAITGTLENIHTAAAQIGTAIQEDVNLKDHMYVTYNSPSSSGPNLGAYANGMGGGGPAGGGFNADYAHFMGGGPGGPYSYPSAGGGGFAPGGFGGSPGSGMSAAVGEMENLQYDPCEISMEVPDSLIGYVIGKNGVHMTDIMKTYGVTIKLSAKNDFVPGTQNRKVTVQGLVANVHRAHARLLFRIKEGSTSPSQGRSAPASGGLFGGPHPVVSGGGVGQQYGGGQSVLSSQGGGQSAQHNAYPHAGGIPYGYQQGYAPYI